MRKRRRAGEGTEPPKRSPGKTGSSTGPAISDVAPAASFPLVGSDVLDVIGSRGVPKREMHDVIHSPDDGIAKQPLGPLQEASVSFRPDPEVGDAGAELAEEFGQNYLRSATTGEDMSELENPLEMSPTEIGGPFVIERPKPARRRPRHRPRRGG